MVQDLKRGSSCRRGAVPKCAKWETQASAQAEYVFPEYDEEADEQGPQRPASSKGRAQ